MATVEENVHIFLNGEEIEPNGYYDYSFRRIPTEKFPYFRGLPSQMTVNPKDKNRIQTWYGDELGHCEQTVLQSDFDEAKYYAAFKNVSVDLLSKVINETQFTIDPNINGIAFLQLNKSVALNILDAKVPGTRLHIVVEVLTRGTSISFANNIKIKWIGEEPEYPTDCGKTYCVTLIWSGVNWYAEQSNGSGEGNSGSEIKKVTSCIDASIMSLGFCLPAGAEVGQIPPEYAAFSGVDNLSDDSLLNIAQVVANAGNINDVAKALPDIGVVEDHVDDISKVSANIAEVVNVSQNLNESTAEAMQAIETIKDHFDELGTVSANINSIEAIGNSIETINNLSSTLGDVDTAIANVNTATNEAIAKFNADLTKAKADGDAAIASINSAITDANTAKTAIEESAAPFTDISANLTAINTVATDIAAVKGVNTRIKQVRDVYDELDAVVAAGNHIDELLAIYKNLTVITNFNTQADPLAQRITALEAKLTELEAKANSLGA